MRINIDMETVQEVRDFLMSDECNFVSNMNDACLSIEAMMLIIQAIEDKCKEIEAELTKEE